MKVFILDLRKNILAKTEGNTLSDFRQGVQLNQFAICIILHKFIEFRKGLKELFIELLRFM